MHTRDQYTASVSESSFDKVCLQSPGLQLMSPAGLSQWLTGWCVNNLPASTLAYDNSEVYVLLFPRISSNIPLLATLTFLLHFSCFLQFFFFYLPKKLVTLQPLSQSLHPVEVVLRHVLNQSGNMVPGLSASAFFEHLLGKWMLWSYHRPLKQALWSWHQHSVF